MLTKHTLVIPVSDYSTNDKTIGDEVGHKDKGSYENDNIIITFGSFIRETTQRILPHSP